MVVSFFVLCVAIIGGGSDTFFGSLFSPEFAFLGSIQHGTGAVVLETGVALLAFGS